MNRRHCDSKWHVQSKAIQSRVATAIKDLPQEDAQIAKILQTENSRWKKMSDEFFDLVF